MQSSSALFSSSVATSTSSSTQAISRKEQALKYMGQLETAFKEGAYGAPDKPFEQALRGLLSLLKSCLGGATPAERMDNPTHLVVRLLTLMSEDALRNLSNDTLRTEYAAIVHAALDLVVIQSYEENWVSLPKTLRTTQGEIGLLEIVSDFNRGHSSIPRQYELDCCKENIQALLEKKGDWTRALDIMKLALAKDVTGLLQYANELRKEIRPLWPVTVLLLRRLTPLAQQSPKALTVLQTAMAEECQRTQFHCHYAAQEALADVIAFSKGAEKAAIRRQALGQRTRAEETKAVRKQPTYWYWTQTRPPELKTIPGIPRKQEDRCRYRLIQDVSELLVQELESKASSHDQVDVLNQLMEMLFYLQETEPAYLKDAQRWIRALSDKVHRDKPKAYVLSGFVEAHPHIEKTHLGDEQKRLQEELRCMQLDVKVQQEALEKAKQEKQALTVEKEALLQKEAAWKQQETTLLQDKAKLEEDKTALQKGKEKDQKQLESLKRQCARVKRELEAAEATQHDLMDELNQLKQGTEPADMQERIQELSEELEEKQAKVKQLSASMQTFNKELEDKTKQLQEKEKALEKDCAALALRQQALEQAEKRLAAQTAALKAEQTKLEERAKALDAQEAYLKAQAEELREKEASLQSLGKAFELQLQDIERGLKKLTISPITSPASPTRPGSAALSLPTSSTVAQRLMALPKEPFDEAFRKQAEEMGDEVMSAYLRCQVLKRPAYDALTLRLMTKAGYEEEHLISEEAARGWLIDQQKTTCPCCNQEVVGIGINRPMRDMVKDKIQSASPKKPAPATSAVSPQSPIGPAALLPTSPVVSSVAVPPASKDKDIKQTMPLSPPGTPSTTGVFKRLPEAPEQGLYAKSMKEAKEVLEHVAWGRQDEAESLLKVKPWLAFVYGEMEEPCSRQWKRVSPFQLAVWGLDWHMWEMMLRCFRDEDYVKAAEQYQALEEGKGEHGKQFSLQPLIEALQTYSEKFSGWTEQQREDHWQKIVGGEQGKLPMSVVHEYCRPDRSFEKRKGMFEEKTLPREKGREKEWFHYDGAMEGVHYKYMLGGKGGDWAWVRSNRWYTYSPSKLSQLLDPSQMPSIFSLTHDGASLLLMSTVRSQQKSKLGQIVSAKTTLTVLTTLATSSAVLTLAPQVASSAAAPPKDAGQVAPISPSGTPSTIGVFKRMPEVSEQSLDAKSMQEAKEVLEHVAWGRQDEAEVLLKQKPWLAFVYGEVEEPCGRKWKRISPFRLALWGLDWHMWEMMLRCFRDEDYEKVAEQYKELEDKGTEHGKQFSLQPLIEALQTYSEKFSGWTEQQRKDHWQKIVGGEQRKLPMSVVHEYCRPDRSFEKQEGMFEEKTLPRWKGREKKWFHYDRAMDGEFTLYVYMSMFALIRADKIARSGALIEDIQREAEERAAARAAWEELYRGASDTTRALHIYVPLDIETLLLMSTVRNQQKSKLGQMVSDKLSNGKGPSHNQSIVPRAAK